MSGIVNLANSLSVIKQYVFENKEFTLDELSRMLLCNWDGFEQIRENIVNRAEFFGNDTDTDILVNRISKTLAEISSKYVPYRGGRYIFGTLTGYEVSHISFGKNTIASPDGRYATDAFAASVSSLDETASGGVVSYLTSASKIDGNFLSSSVVVNLTLEKSMIDTADKKIKFADMIKTFFTMGGIQLQINYLSAEELIQAQKSPQKYKNLRVRVTGFSGFFTSFDTDLQNEIIQRTLYQG